MGGRGGFSVATASGVSSFCSGWCWCCCIPSSTWLSSCRARDVGMLGETTPLFFPAMLIYGTNARPSYRRALWGSWWTRHISFQDDPRFIRNSHPFPPPPAEQRTPVQLLMWFEYALCPPPLAPAPGSYWRFGS